MPHDADDDDCGVPGCPVHDPQTPVEVPEMARVGIRLNRNLPEILPGTVETGSNRQPFEATIILSCTGCMATHKWLVPGHHLRTLHRVLGQLLENYPAETQELIPDGPEVQTPADKRFGS